VYVNKWLPFVRVAVLYARRKKHIEEGTAYGSNTREPPKTRMATMSTLPESSADLSSDRPRTLVSEMRRDSQSVVETKESKGGEIRHIENVRSARGKLIVDLCRLKAYCEQQALSQSRLYFSRGHKARNYDHNTAQTVYREIAKRIGRLIDMHTKSGN
jgi:hypothetical protein